MICEQCSGVVGVQGKRFCSTACWYAFTKARRTVPCEVCEVPFERKIKSQRACSKICGDVLKRAKKETSCRSCGVTFERPHGKQRIFCSRTCAMRSRNRVGQVTKSEGDTIMHMAGYIQQKRAGAWVMQHRLVMEEKLGRKLESHERVHHRDGVRHNNAPENLELWTTGHKDPPGVRALDNARKVIQSLAPADLETLLRDFSAS